jgi:hypothetical protein
MCASAPWHCGARAHGLRPAPAAGGVRAAVASLGLGSEELAALELAVASAQSQGARSGGSEGGRQGGLPAAAPAAAAASAPTQAKAQARPERKGDGGKGKGKGGNAASTRSPLLEAPSSPFIPDGVPAPAAAAADTAAALPATSLSAAAAVPAPAAEGLAPAADPAPPRPCAWQARPAPAGNAGSAGEGAPGAPDEHRKPQLGAAPAAAAATATPPAAGAAAAVALAEQQRGGYADAGSAKPLSDPAAAMSAQSAAPEGVLRPTSQPTLAGGVGAGDEGEGESVGKGVSEPVPAPGLQHLQEALPLAGAPGPVFRGRWLGGPLRAVSGTVAEWFPVSCPQQRAAVVAARVRRCATCSLKTGRDGRGDRRPTLDIVISHETAR